MKITKKVPLENGEVELPLKVKGVLLIIDFIADKKDEPVTVTSVEVKACQHGGK